MDWFEQQFVERVPELLSEFIDEPVRSVHIPEREEGSPDIVVQVGSYTFLVETKASGAAGSAQQLVERIQHFKPRKKHDILLAAVPHMGPAGKRYCKEQKVSWIDLSGNACIRGPGLLVRVSGARNQHSRPGRKANVFSRKSSRVVRQLLLDPLGTHTQKDLVRMTGLGQGFVSRILTRLKDDGFINSTTSNIRVRQPSRLLDAWEEFYDFSKHTIVHGHMSSRSATELLDRVVAALQREDLAYATTGLAGAWLLTHFAKFRICTFYLHEMPSKMTRQDIGFRPTTRGANVWFVLPNDDDVFSGCRDINDVTVAHPVQVYLDLRNHPERSREAADHLRGELLDWSSHG
jgi:hypothetical protein